MELENTLLGKHNIALANLKDELSINLSQYPFNPEAVEKSVDKFLLSSPLLENLIACRDALRAVATVKTSVVSKKDANLSGIVKDALRQYKLNLRNIDELVIGITADSMAAELEILNVELATIEADISRMAQLSLQYDNVSVPVGLTTRAAQIKNRIAEINKLMGN